MKLCRNLGTSLLRSEFFFISIYSISVQGRNFWRKFRIGILSEPDRTNSNYSESCIRINPKLFETYSCQISSKLIRPNPDESDSIRNRINSDKKCSYINPCSD